MKLYYVEHNAAVGHHAALYQPCRADLGTNSWRSAAPASVCAPHPSARICCSALQIELIAKAAGGVGGGAGGGPRTLSSGIRISGEKGGTRMVQLTRHFQQASAFST